MPPIPGELIPIVLFVMMGFTAVLYPVARAFGRKIDRESLQPKVPQELQQCPVRSAQCLARGAALHHQAAERASAIAGASAKAAMSNDMSDA